MPALFWSLALLLMPEQAEARARVLQELQETADGIRTQQQQQPSAKQQQLPVKQEVPAGLDHATVSAMLQLSLDKRSWVSHCVAEAIRLRVHSIAGEGAGPCLPAPRPAPLDEHSACTCHTLAGKQGAIATTRPWAASCPCGVRGLGTDSTGMSDL